MRPRLLDLFCGAGGAAVGYHRAGFDVVGVDINPQPHYPFEFHQGDAIEYLSETMAEGFDLIHASPPCQHYSIMRNLSWLRGRAYWDSVPPTKAAIAATELPYVIENVVGAPLDGITLCGQMFGMDWPDGRPIYRHRLFESSAFMLAPAHPKHYRTIQVGHQLRSRARVGAGIAPEMRLVTSGRTRIDGSVIGIDWMTALEVSQAIPPAYTTWIGAQLLAALTATA